MTENQWSFFKLIGQGLVGLLSISACVMIGVGLVQGEWWAGFGLVLLFTAFLGGITVMMPFEEGPSA